MSAAAAAADSEALRSAIDARLPLAEALFDAIRAASAAEHRRDPSRLERAGPDAPPQHIADSRPRARRWRPPFDHAGNLYCTLPGRDQSAPAVLTGSHLDSVPAGGHFDGLAGAVAGLVVLAAFRDIGPGAGLRRGARMATRGEESVWFGIPFVGARLATRRALPRSPRHAAARRHRAHARPAHGSASGLDVDGAAPRGSAAHRARQHLPPSWSCTSSRGRCWWRRACRSRFPPPSAAMCAGPPRRCLGRYDHSGATPRAHRQDTVLATAELAHALEAFWIAQEEGGTPDTVFTVGKFFTDGGHHAMTKIPGRCDFTLNFGGTTQAFLDACRAEVEARAAKEIGGRRRVSFDLGDCVEAAPAPLDEALRTVLEESAAALDIPTRQLRHRRARCRGLPARRHSGRDGPRAQRPWQPQSRTRP